MNNRFSESSAPSKPSSTWTFHLTWPSASHGPISATISESEAGAGPNPPYGGTIVDLFVDEGRAAEMKATAGGFAALTLDDRTLCDLEMLATGGFSPLTGFLGRADYDRVVAVGA